MDFELFGTHVRTEDINRNCTGCNTPNPHYLLRCRNCGQPTSHTALPGNGSWNDMASPSQQWHDLQPAQALLNGYNRMHGTKCSNPQCGLENPNLSDMTEKCKGCGHENFVVKVFQDWDGILNLHLVPFHKTNFQPLGSE